MMPIREGADVVGAQQAVDQIEQLRKEPVADGGDPGELHDRIFRQLEAVGQELEARRQRVRELELMAAALDNALRPFNEPKPDSPNDSRF